MDDHFWPSLYPGLIIGALVGLADGSIWSDAVRGTRRPRRSVCGVHLR